MDKRAPITVKFEIPYFTVSGIQVRYLKIVEKSGYQALPWVRYITQNGDDYRCVYRRLLRLGLLVADVRLQLADGAREGQRADCTGDVSSVLRPSQCARSVCTYTCVQGCAVCEYYLLDRYLIRAQRSGLLLFYHPFFCSSGASRADVPKIECSGWSPNSGDVPLITIQG